MSSVVPDGWETKQLSALLRVPEKNKEPNPREVEILTVKLHGKGVVRSRKFPNPTIKGRPYFRRYNGELLIGRQNLHNLGLGLVTPETDGLIASNAISSFVGNEGDILFMHQILSASIFQNEVNNLSSGTGQKEVSEKQILNLRVLTPPLPEQKKIASILTSVDEVIERTQKQIDKLQDLKKATMNELLTKGIGHTEFKDSELGRIPKSWEVKSLDKLTNKVGSGMTPRGGSAIYQSTGIVFIRSQNVHFDGLKLGDIAHISEELHLGMKGSNVLGGDVLLNITGASIGRCAVAPETFYEANVNQHVCIIRPTKSLHNKFVGMWLSSDYGQDQIMRFQAGGNREGLNFEQIRSIRIPVPKMNEQKQVSKVVETIQEQINKVKSKLQQTQFLKKAVMQDLLTGKVRVKVD